MPANMLSIRPSGSFRPRRRPNVLSNSASLRAPASSARRSASAPGSERTRFFTASGSSPSSRQKAAKLSQTEVVSTPPKSKKVAAYAPDMEEQANEATAEAPEGIERAGVE